MPDTATSTELPTTCPRHGNPDAPGPMCPDCSERALADLRTAADAYPELATTTEIATRPSLGRSGNVFPGSPSPACDHADAILHALRDAEDWLRVELDHRPARLPHAHRTEVVAAARAYLERHHDVAMATEWAAAYATALRRLASGVSQHLPADRQTTVHLPLEGLCPDCKATALYRISGTDRVTCRACGNGLSWAQYQGHFEHLRRMAAGIRAA